MTVANEQVEKNFSRAAARYDELAVLQQQWLRRGIDWALEAFPKKARILDIGCGTGLFTQETRSQRPHWRCFGLDIAFGMCATALGREVKVVQADAQRLPFADKSFDGVFSSLCLQWVNDKPAAIAEIARVLKPGGKAVIVTLGGANLQELHEVSGGEMKLLPMEPVDAYRGWIAQAGLKVTRGESQPERHHYENAYALLNSMRVIGAGNAMAEHRAPQAPRPHIARITSEYDKRYQGEHGVYATWQPILLLAAKGRA